MTNEVSTINVLKSIWKKFKIEYLFYFFLFLLPWQTRFIFREGNLNGGYWEYGTLSLYATDLVFLCVLAGFFYWNWREWNGTRDIIRGEPVPSGFSTSLWVVISLFELWVFLSLFWARDLSLGVYFYIRILEGIGFIFVLGHELLDATYLRLSLIGSALLQALFGVVQFFLQYIPASKWLGLSEHFAGAPGAAVVATSTERWLRAYGSFEHPNIFAAFLVVGFLIHLPYYYEVIPRKRDRVLLFCVTLILLLGIFVAFSRAAWLGLVVGILFFLFIKGKEKKPKTRMYPLVLFIAIFLFASLLRDPLFTRLRGTAPLEVRSTSERVTQYEESLAMILWKPLHGVGAGQYTLVLHDDIDPNRESFSYQPVHNVYLLLATELGLVGLFFFTILILFPTILFQKKPILILIPSHYAVIGAVLFMGLFDHYLWSLQSGRWILFLALGLHYRTEFLMRKKEELQAQKDALGREKLRLLKIMEKEREK